MISEEITLVLNVLHEPAKVVLLNLLDLHSRHLLVHSQHPVKKTALSFKQGCGSGWVLHGADP